MKTYNFCKRIDVETKVLLYKWAKRLEADEMTIHKDGSVTLMCKDGCICDNYKPTASELYKQSKPLRRSVGNGLPALMMTDQRTTKEKSVPTCKQRTAHPKTTKGCPNIITWAKGKKQ